MAFAEHCRATYDLTRDRWSSTYAVLGSSQRDLGRAGRAGISSNYTVSEPISEFFSVCSGGSHARNRLPTLTAPIQARTTCGTGYIAIWRKGVTITLRESTYNENRNSDLSEWLASRRKHNPDIYCPIFVRDTERCFEPLAQSSTISSLALSHPSTFHFGWSSMKKAGS